MNNTEKFRPFRNVIIKLMGLLVAPFAFSIILCGILLLIANTTVGDVIGYGSVLFLKQPEENYGVTDFLLATQPDETVPEEENTINIQDISFPTYEQVYGEISIPAVDILCPLIYGDTNAALKKGACQFIGSTIIGYGGTSMICAHVNRHFANLHMVEPGDIVQIRTTYGVYTYEVKYVGIHRSYDRSVYDLGREDENIVLYTCYYQYTALGSVKMRFYVCADYVSGPMIVDRGGQS